MDRNPYQAPEHTNQDRPPSRRSLWPWWVNLALWKVPGRMTAWLFFWATVALGVGVVAYAVLNPLYWIRWIAVALVAVAGASHYWLAIRWVDRNDAWQ